VVPNLTLSVALLIAALVLAVFFAAAETALLALRPAVWLAWVEQRRWRGRLFVRLHRHRPLVMATLMAGGVGSLYLFAYLAVHLALNTFTSPWAPWLVFLGAAVVGVTLGVALPVNVAARHGERAARFLAAPAAALTVLLSPVMLLLVGSARLVLLARGVSNVELHPSLTEDELKALLAQGTREGALPEAQRQMMYGVLDFADQTAAQVMTPRPDMISADADAPLRAALASGLQHRHRRLPVYEENDDDIVGVLYLKDILPYLRDQELEEPARVAARPAFYVPESLPAADLLRQLQQTRQTIAIVRDEFGGTAGLVTVEDLVEQIVGPIRDEDDTAEEPEIVKISETELSCNGMISLHPLENLLRVELPEDEYDTLAGFVLDLAGHIPDQGESFTYGALTLVAERVHGHRLERIRVSKRADYAEREDRGHHA
jgi:CBS domain containing-hemolysin-like protein